MDGTSDFENLTGPFTPHLNTMSDQLSSPDYIVNLYQYEDNINRTASQYVQNIISFHKDNNEAKEISNIYYNLLNQTRESSDKIEDDDEIIKHKNIILTFQNSLSDFLTKINEQNSTQFNLCLKQFNGISRNSKQFNGISNHLTE